jgi:hypothetical protein
MEKDAIKKSFYKYLNNLVYKNYRTFPKLELHVDEHVEMIS